MFYACHLTTGRETSARIGFATPTTKLTHTQKGLRVTSYRVSLSNFLDQIRLCLLSAKGTRGAPDTAAQDLLCGRIETTSCAVDAEGHLNATVMVEVVNTFSSFQVP
jgi:hypothetical protein